MFGEFGDYKGQALISRFLGRLETYTIENDTRNGFKVHYFTVRQIHPKYALIMDWQYKIQTGKEPKYINK